MSGSAKKRGEISPQQFVRQTRETRAVFKIPKKNKFRKHNKAARNLEQMKFDFNFDERETEENILKTHCL